MSTPLAPKRWCNECNKPVGRKWSNYNLCRSCIRKATEAKELDSKHDPKTADIPY